MSAKVAPKYIEHFEQGDYLYSVTELKSIGDLHTYMRDRALHFFSEGELRTHVAQMARCVDAVHREGYLHNELMPWNFCLNGSSKNDRKKATIIGLSRATQIGNLEWVQAFLQGLSYDELVFKSPEVLQLQADKVGPPSDVYTLGVTLYTLAYNKRPFNTVEEVLNGAL